jgi:acetone carboxylase gamma subunit
MIAYLCPECEILVDDEAAEYDYGPMNHICPQCKTILEDIHDIEFKYTRYKWLHELLEIARAK